MSAGLQSAFGYARVVHDRTGGRDHYLGLRHVLFALGVLGGETKAEVDAALAQLNGVNGRWIARTLVPSLQHSLEDGESWSEWEKIFTEKNVYTEDNARDSVLELDDAARFVINAAWALAERVRGPSAPASSFDALLFVSRLLPTGQSETDLLRQLTGFGDPHGHVGG